jgi:hypothetical protein
MHYSRRTASAVRALAIAATVAAVGLAACGSSDDESDADAIAGAEATTSAPESSTRDPSADSSVQNAAAARFVEAVNAGSTDRVTDTLTDDAVVIDTGRRFADPDSIREWVESEVTGVDGRITVRNERATDDGVVLTVDFGSSGFSGTDLRYTFTTRGDRVASLTLG